ncbi:sensor histidine kinase KdpD [Terribacillus sp. DMT04]|uniref:sensor histidine kinase KdpD n=1 Tax=Terribacillus sp. DMT04 TaxID=2850441 RepID=UPI001C2B918C|nr:sensor histidine kinase KdpD [Terribacillus sp. DMT04]
MKINEEAVSNSKRGRLTLYIGAAPGVGKTYKMLIDAKQMLEENVDVVIGLIETHGRMETEAQLSGLEQVALQTVHYKGRSYQELHVDAILLRQPKVVLIDELAHTNIPGSKHAKRYQDVTELLDAGIDVLAAVNIQHLESVYDIVQNITNVRVNERVPDLFIQTADEIQLIDTTPETLQKRLREGKIYPAERIEKSLLHYFKLTNLSALRELALREIADEVDEKLERQSGADFKGPIGVHEKILICVQHLNTAERLVRRGYRMANRLRAELYVLHISCSKETDEEKITYIRGLCAKFNAHFLLKITNKRVAHAIVAEAKKYYITQVLLGQSARTRWEEIWKGSIVNTIMRQTRNIDVHVVADQQLNR